MKPLPILEIDGLPSCKGCGACCFFPLGVFLTQDDIKRIDKDLFYKDEYFYPRGHRLKTVKSDGHKTHCIAFDPEKRECKIYEDRPENCITFSRGNRECLNDVEELKNIINEE